MRVSHDVGTLIPVTTRRDMVFDHSGQYLYISTSDGRVQRYNLTTSQLDVPYNLGGFLNGIDIAHDDSCLLVAQSNTVTVEGGTFHRIDLGTGTVTNINYDKVEDEGNAWDVAIASNGIAMVTTQAPYTGTWVPLRQIDLATNSIQPRSDWDGGLVYTEEKAQIERSADGTLIYLLDISGTFVPIFFYDARTNIVGPAVRSGWGWYGASTAVNRDGTLVATRRDDRIVLDAPPNFHFVRTLNRASGSVAFDPTQDILYVTNGDTAEIVAYNTQTFAESFRLKIGETLTVSSQFTTGNLVASPDGRHLAISTVSGVRLLTLPSTAPAPSPTPTPSLGTSRDMVFDHAGRHLYISTDEGFVFPYNLDTETFETPWDLGGSLRGIDIAPDDSYLLVSQHTVGMTEAMIHKVNLKSGSVTNLNYKRRDEFEGGGWDIAIGSNFLALLSTDGIASYSPLRQISLATNIVTVRDAPTVNGSNNDLNVQAQISRSADGSRFYFLESMVFTFDAIGNSFGPGGARSSAYSPKTIAVSRDGSLLATQFNATALDSAPDFNFLHSFNQPDGGLSFDATRNRLYAVKSSTSEIIAYDTDTFAELYRWPIGGAIPPGVTSFGSGNLIASGDGRTVALQTSSGVRVIPLPDPIPSPTPSPPPSLSKPRDIVFDHSGRYLYITTDTGLVFPYNISNQALESPYDLGGSLGGADISSDDSFLIVAQKNTGVKQGMFQRIDLINGDITRIPYMRETYESYGANDVVIASNGLALGTAVSGPAPIRQIDLATNTISSRNDVPGNGSYNPANVMHCANGNLFFWGSPAFFYYPATNSFGTPLPDLSGTGGAQGLAVNRDGTLLGQSWYPGYTTLKTIPTLSSKHTFNNLDGGVTFDGTKDLFYGSNSAIDQIIAYDTNNFTEKFRFDVGEDISYGSSAQGYGLLVESPDAHHLAFLTTNAHVRVFDIPALYLNGVVSDDGHGQAGPFDIGLPLDGTRVTECRNGGADQQYTLIFTFNTDVSSIGGASVTNGNGTIAGVAINIADRHQCVVSLSSVSNQQYLRVTLYDVRDSLGNHTDSISQRLPVLVGDTNNDGLVNSADVSQTKAFVGNQVSNANFREDVNADGVINSADVALVKSKIGTNLPANPPPGAVELRNSLISCR